MYSDQPPFARGLAPRKAAFFSSPAKFDRIAKRFITPLAAPLVGRDRGLSKWITRGIWAGKRFGLIVPGT